MNTSRLSSRRWQSPSAARDKPRIAFVQDALPFMGGAERMLIQALRTFPNTPIYTLVYNPANFHASPLQEAKIHTTFIDRLPGAHQNHRIYFPLYPLAVESLDLSAYDLVVSFSYAACHGVFTRPDQRHVTLYYTPLRLAYRQIQAAANRETPRSRLLYHLLHAFRRWDRLAAQRSDQVYAISHWVAKQVREIYRRSVQVIYPPVEIERFHSGYSRDSYYICVSRMEPHKRLDLLIQAFNRTKRPLVLVGEGREKNRLRKMAAGNIHFLDQQSDDEIARLLSRARAFVHAAAEDFGIALVESQAAGCPVIAYRQGGAGETVVQGQTGILFPEQTAESLNAAISMYEANANWFSPEEIRSSVTRFSAERFREKFAAIVHAREHTYSIRQVEQYGHPTTVHALPGD